MKMSPKVLSWSLIVVLWLVVLGTAAEVFATWRLRTIERTNPYIGPLRAEGRVPSNEHVPSPPPKADVLGPHAPVSWVTDVIANPSGSDSFCRCGTPSDTATEAEVERRREVFPSLSEPDRLDCATIHSEAVIQLTESGTIRALYNLDAAALLPRYRKLLANAAKTRATHYESAEEAPNSRTYMLYVPAEHSFYVFCKLFRQRLTQTLSPNSPWEIPFLKYKKNLSDTYSGMGEAHNQTNNFGFRGPDVVLPKPKGRFRIICVGGSTTEEGYKDGTYPKFLEGRLRNRFPERDIEVVNCGVSGKTTTGSVTLLPDYFALEPDLIIVYEGVNDICQELSHWFVEFVNGSNFIRQYMPGLSFPSTKKIDTCLDQLPIRNIHGIRRAAACRGIPVAVCSLAFPDPAALTEQERQYFDYNARTCWGAPNLTINLYARMAGRLNMRIRALCERDKMLYIPVHENIGGGLYYMSDICHMYARGVERKADIIASHLNDCLAALFALPPAP